MGKKPVLFYSVFIFLLLAGWGMSASGRDIAVTSITVDPGKTSGIPGARVVINDVLDITGVRLIRLGDRTLVQFPEYVSKRKRIYPQFRLLSRQAKDELVRALTSRAARAPAAGRTGYRVTTMSLFRKKSNLKAFSAVVFDDAVEVQCKIIEGKNGPWVAWPSERKRSGEGWIRYFSLLDKPLREAVEQDLLEKYFALSQEEGLTP